MLPRGDLHNVVVRVMEEPARQTMSKCALLVSTRTAVAYARSSVTLSPHVRSLRQILLLRSYNSDRAYYSLPKRLQRKAREGERRTVTAAGHNHRHPIRCSDLRAPCSVDTIIASAVLEHARASCPRLKMFGRSASLPAHEGKARHACVRRASWAACIACRPTWQNPR